MKKNKAKIYCIDCIEGMKKLPDNCIDTIITDPPYNLKFMGKKWDSSGIAFQVKVWEEALRVMKPGAMLFAFGGTRTSHRLTCAIEDAGFEIRDCLMWLHGQGFPKSHDISKAIQKASGVLPDKIEPASGVGFMQPDSSDWNVTKSKLTMPELEGMAKQWTGQGTALKPAHEPIILAMKPLDGTFAENALKWGVAGLNIDAGRIKTNDKLNGGATTGSVSASEGWDRPWRHVKDAVARKTERAKIAVIKSEIQGRWPANVILDEEAATMLDEQSGKLTSGYMAMGTKRSTGGGYHGNFPEIATLKNTYADSGGASRFFYVAKASRKERNAGLEGMEGKQRDEGRKEGNPSGDNPRNRGVKKVQNYHPTVKPIKLLEYLCKLSRPPKATGGIVLDMFVGSGSTALACLNTKRNFIGFDNNKGYVGIAKKRIAALQAIAR